MTNGFIQNRQKIRPKLVKMLNSLYESYKFCSIGRILRRIRPAKTVHTVILVDSEALELPKLDKISIGPVDGGSDTLRYTLYGVYGVKETPTPAGIISNIVS